MLRIKISFQNEQELSMVLELLRPLIKKCKYSKNKASGYNKVYIITREENEQNIQTNKA